MTVASGFTNKRFSYGLDGNVEYIGENSDPRSNDSSSGWEIIRILYDAEDRVVYRKGPLKGRWVDREALDW